MTRCRKEPAESVKTLAQRLIASLMFAMLFPRKREPYTPHRNQMKLLNAFAVACVISTSFISGSPAFAKCRVDDLSMPSQTNAKFSVTNFRNSAVSLIWVTFDGNRKSYMSIGPGETFMQPTYTNHVWLIEEEGTGRCLTSIRLGTSNQHLIIR